jgi:hypothetical protein
MRFTPNLVIGLVVTTLGAALMLERLDVVNAGELFRYWPIALILFGASIVAQAFHGGEAQPVGAHRRRARSGLFWLIVLFVVPMVIMRSNAREGWAERAERRVENLFDRRADAGVERTGGRDTFRIVAVMGEDQRAAFDAPFGGAKMTTVMGSSRLDLREARLEPGEVADIDVFGMMGELNIIVPEGWIVDVRTTPVMGAVKDQRWRVDRQPRDATGAPAEGDQSRPRAQGDAETPPRVVVRGFVMMGALRISS